MLAKDQRSTTNAERAAALLRSGEATGSVIKHLVGAGMSRRTAQRAIAAARIAGAAAPRVRLSDAREPHQLRVTIPGSALEKVKAAARKRNTTACRLAGAIIDLVANDGLIDTILDDKIK